MISHALKNIIKISSNLRKNQNFAHFSTTFFQINFRIPLIFLLSYIKMLKYIDTYEKTSRHFDSKLSNCLQRLGMAFGRVVMTFSGFNLPYVGVAPHQRLILSILMGDLVLVASVRDFHSHFDNQVIW